MTWRFGRVIFRERSPRMADYRIDCINKPDRNSTHEHITHVGGPKPDGSGRWKDTVPNVVGFIEAKTHRFYTSEGGVSAWSGFAPVRADGSTFRRRRMVSGKTIFSP